MKIVYLFFLLFLCSCTTTLIPASKGELNVAVLDHGRHSSLLLLHEGKSYRYSYGDWDFYAKAENTFVNGVKALFWPTKSALGRNEIPGPFKKENLLKHLPDGLEEIFMFHADQRLVVALKESLDQIYFKNIQSRRETPEYGLVFVSHPETYWVFNNSNQMVGRWLEALGLEVEGKALFSTWRMR